jgi:fusion and transport protein UGO1
MAPNTTQELRPYYDHDTFNAGYSVIFTPGVGLIDMNNNKPLSSSVSSSIKATNNGLKIGSRAIGIHGVNELKKGSVVGKDYVNDLEFLEYFDVNNFTELFKNLVWNFLKNYCKVMLSQPLEIVRLVLQVGVFDFGIGNRKKMGESCRKSTPSSSLLLADMDMDYSDTEINYFETTGTRTDSVTKKPATQQKPAASDDTSSRNNKSKIAPISIHTMDIMTSIVAKDGPFALFKGVNAAFIYSTLSHTIEAWITGFLSPFLGVPDPFFLDLTHSNDPFKSLWLSVSACVLMGLILMPLDLIRVKLMITQFNKPAEVDSDLSSDDSDISLPVVNTRSVRESLRNYPLLALYRPPPSITLLTILHQLSQSIFRKTTPYVLFIKFNIDSYSAPNVYTIVNLILLIFEFFIKLPVENLLRKEQVKFLIKPKSFTEDPMRVITIENPEENLIVEFNDHYQDLQNRPISMFERIRRLGLFNGWRVGVLNVIGFWGYNILKTNTTDIIAERL